MLRRWVLLLVSLLVWLGWSRPTLAADACSDLFTTPSLYLTGVKCDGTFARLEFDDNVSKSCVGAARSGMAEESMRRLAVLALSSDRELDRSLPCRNERRELAQYALCMLHPPNHREWLRPGISTKSWNEYGIGVVAECLGALIDDGDEAALDDAYGSARPASTRESRWSDMLSLLVGHDSAAVRERAVKRLDWAAQEGRSEAHVLEQGLCVRRQPESAYATMVCKVVRARETSRLEEVILRRSPELYELRDRRCSQLQPASPREERLCEAATTGVLALNQRASQQDDRRALRLKAGLSAMSVILFGAHLGLTIQYRDHVAGQILQTTGGIATFVLLERDIMHATGTNGLADALISMAAIPTAIALGGGIGYASSLNRTSLIVIASTNNAFSLGSVLGLMWAKQ